MDKKKIKTDRDSISNKGRRVIDLRKNIHLLWLEMLYSDFIRQYVSMDSLTI